MPTYLGLAGRSERAQHVFVHQAMEVMVLLVGKLRQRRVFEYLQARGVRLGSRRRRRATKRGQRARVKARARVRARARVKARARVRAVVRGEGRGA